MEEESNRINQAQELSPNMCISHPIVNNINSNLQTEFEKSYNSPEKLTNPSQLNTNNQNEEFKIILDPNEKSTFSKSDFDLNQDEFFIEQVEIKKIIKEPKKKNQNIQTIQIEEDILPNNFNLKNSIPEKLLPESYIKSQIFWTLEEGIWKEEKKHSNPPGIIYSCPWPENPNLNAIKIVVTLNCKIPAILEVLHDQMIERHKDWNSTFLEGRIVEKIDNDCNIQYWRFRKKGIVDRDFVVVRRKITRSNGTVILFDKSVEHQDCPPIKQVVRCYLPVNLRILKPNDENETVQLTYMNYTDVKGKIPYWLVNFGNPSTSWEELCGIKNICEHLGVAKIAEKLLSKLKAANIK